MPRFRMTGPAFPLVLALAAGSLTALPARAQNALGDGRGLDNNLQVGSGRVNAPRRSLQSELDFRNAIVTGNVGGGKQFRGDVGYSAANDFRGRLGSDDIFNFQRETTPSAVRSGLATRNLRGIDALRSQMDLPLAGQSQGIGGQLIINRPGASASAAQIAAPLQQTMAMDPFTRISGTIRSTSRSIFDAAVEPDILAASQALAEEAPATTTVGSQVILDSRTAPTARGTGDVLGYLVASELHGVRQLPVGSAALGSHEQALARSAPRNRLDPQATRLSGDPLGSVATPATADDASGTYQSALNELRRRADLIQPERVTLNPTGMNPAEPPPTDAARPADAEAPAQDQPATDAPTTPALPSLPGLPGSPSSGSVLDAPAPGNAPAPTTPTPSNEPVDRTIDPLVRLLDELRSGMDAVPPADVPIARDATPPGPAGPSIPGADGVRIGTDPNRKAEPADKSGGAARDVPGALPSETLRRARELLGKQPYRINTVIPQQSSQEIFKSHMAEAQKAMEEGSWFNAEERFTTALAIVPGDPMASIGRANAQLAAGLVVSAGINLRSTLRAYPELMAAQFDDKLMPRGERFDKVVAKLRSRASADTEQARDAGLLLAYLGRQRGDQALMKEGFGIIDRVEAALDLNPDPLDTTLRAVWLDEEPGK